MMSSRTCSARSMSSYPIAHKCSDCVIVVLLFSKLAASAPGALSRLLGLVQRNPTTRDSYTPFPFRFMQGQFLCQASRDVQFFRKALSEKGHRPRSSAEGTAPCQRRRAQGLPGGSRLASTVSDGLGAVSAPYPQPRGTRPRVGDRQRNIGLFRGIFYERRGHHGRATVLNLWSLPPGLAAKPSLAGGAAYYHPRRSTRWTPPTSTVRPQTRAMPSRERTRAVHARNRGGLRAPC